MKIALLLPRSIFYPSLSFDLMDGLKHALKKEGLEGIHEIVSTGIGVAAKNEEIYERCEQLLLEGADIVAGYINPMAAEAIHPLFVSSGKILLALDSGYHFPNFTGKLSNAYFISLQGNLCARAMVRKAIDDGYKNFAFTCSFYDAGYRPSYTYAASVEEKGATIGCTHITALKRSEFTLEPVSEYLSENKDAALLASFCGDMTEDFFNQSTKLNLNAHPLYTSGFTAEEQWLEKIPYAGYEFNAAIPWSKFLDTPENKTFTNVMEGIKKDKANVFCLLGWEAGLFIAAIKDGSLDGVEIDSPRGKVYMNPENRFTDAPVYYAVAIKNDITGNYFLKDIEPANHLNEEREILQKSITSLQTTNTSSWYNAYACLDS